MPKKPLPTDGSSKSQRDFEDAYERYSPRIFRYILWRTGHKAESEDLTSIVFAKAWKSWASFVGGSLSAWLYTIARNVLTDHWRHKQETASEDLDNQPSGQEELSIILDKERRIAELQRAIKRLPPNMQVVIRLRFIEGVSTSQAAVKLQISEGNLRIIQFRALRKLRKYLS